MLSRAGIAVFPMHPLNYNAYSFALHMKSVATVGDLINQTFHFCFKSHWKQLLFGLVLYIVMLLPMMGFGVFIGIQSAILGQDPVIQEEIAYMTEEAATDYLVEKVMFNNIIPLVGVYILTILAAILFQLMLYVLIIRSHKNVRQACKEAWSVLLPFIGQQLLFATMSIASFIPVILVAVITESIAITVVFGLIVLAMWIYVGPRLSLASILLIQEKAGICASIKQSFVRSAGYWCKIVFNTLLFMLLTYAVMFGFILVLGIAFALCAAVGAAIVGMFGEGIVIAIAAILCGIILFATYMIGLYYISLLPITFTVKMGQTILENPKK